MEKIFNQKNFNNFVWSPLGSRGNIYINFCIQVHFHVSAAWYCSHYLPPVSLIPVAIWLRRRCHWWQICRRCQQHKRNWWQNLPPVSLIPVANLPPVSLIPATICHRCCWHRWCTLTCEYLRECSNKFEKNDPSVIFRGLGDGDSWKKTWSKKSRDTVPLSPSNRVKRSLIMTIRLLSMKFMLLHSTFFLSV